MGNVPSQNDYLFRIVRGRGISMYDLHRIAFPFTQFLGNRLFRRIFDSCLCDAEWTMGRSPEMITGSEHPVILPEALGLMHPVPCRTAQAGGS